MKQWYYAKDGQKFGPFQKSHMLELYQKGEISPNDLVWEEGTADWIPAANALKTTSDTPPEPAARPRRFGPIDCIRRAWDLTWKFPAHIIGGALIALIITSTTQIPAQISSQLANIEKHSLDLHSPIVITCIILYALSFLLMLIVTPLISTGACWMILRIIRGHTPEFTDLFIAFKNFKLAAALILANLSVLLLTLLGFIALIIPGIYLAVAYSFTAILVIDKRLGIWESMELSRRIVTKRWWSVLAFVLLLALINLLGILACCVGSIIAAPVCYASIVCAYDSLFSDEK
jgi:uncharacterized membrane protein